MSEEHEITLDNYRIWKRNSLSLYDLCVTHVLQFPTLSLDFQCVAKVNQLKNQALVSFVFSTNTPMQQPREENALYVKQLILPSVFTPQPQDTISKSESGLIVGGYGILKDECFGKLQDQFWQILQLEANQLICVPSDPDLVLVLTDDDLLMYDLKQMMMRQQNTTEPFSFNDSDGGFSLSLKNNIICHGGNNLIQFFDLQSKQKIWQIEVQTAVNGISFSPFYNTAAAVTDEGELLIIDHEKRSSRSFLLGDLAESFIGTAIAFSYQNEDQIAIGSADGRLMLLSLAQMTFKITQAHEKSIFQVKFSPFYPLILTGSEDSKCSLWNFQLKKIFTHQGHTMAITDCKFHPQIPNLIASTAEDNSLQFWWPAENAFE